MASVTSLCAEDRNTKFDAQLMHDMLAIYKVQMCVKKTLPYRSSGFELVEMIVSIQSTHTENTYNILINSIKNLCVHVSAVSCNFYNKKILTKKISQ